MSLGAQTAWLSLYRNNTCIDFRVSLVTIGFASIVQLKGCLQTCIAMAHLNDSLRCTMFLISSTTCPSEIINMLMIKRGQEGKIISLTCILCLEDRWSKLCRTKSVRKHIQSPIAPILRKTQHRLQSRWWHQ